MKILLDLKVRLTTFRFDERVGPYVIDLSEWANQPDPRVRASCPTPSLWPFSFSGERSTIRRKGRLSQPAPDPTGKSQGRSLKKFSAISLFADCLSSIMAEDLKNETNESRRLKSLLAPKECDDPHAILLGYPNSCLPKIEIQYEV